MAVVALVASVHSNKVLAINKAKIKGKINRITKVTIPDNNMVTSSNIINISSNGVMDHLAMDKVVRNKLITLGNSLKPLQAKMVKEILFTMNSNLLVVDLKASNNISKGNQANNTNNLLAKLIRNFLKKY